MPRFHVRDAFAVQDKTTFVLAGFIIEGEVTKGMSITIPFNSTVKMTATIDRIEHVPRPDGDVVCLCLDCAVPDEVVLWEALNIRNRSIEITASA